MDRKMGAPHIRLAETQADFDAFAQVCRAYLGWCRARYADMPWFVDEVFGHQSFEAELKCLSAKYSPPAGRVMIAELDGQVVGGGAHRRLSEDGVCELKRLYVTDAARGHGLGRKLSEALMSSAKADGFTLMRLDTAHRLTEAIAMYGAMGFTHIPPYLEYPDRLMPYLVFMKRAL